MRLLCSIQVLSMMFTIILNTALSSKNNLRMTTDCLCPEVNHAYFQCTAVGGLFTVWRGSALLGGCEIILRHSNFDSGQATGACNNGAVIAEGVNVDNGCYTSQLTLIPNLSIEGQTLECAVDNGVTETVINRTILHLTKGIIVTGFKVSLLINLNNNYLLSYNIIVMSRLLKKYLAFL